MDMASKEQDWVLDFAEIAKIWRAGCIIRAVFLQSITNAYEQDDKLANLLLDPYFAQQIADFYTLQELKGKNEVHLKVVKKTAT